MLEGTTKTRQYTKDELVNQLKARGITAKGKKDIIQKIALEQGLPIEETKARIIEGWEGKPKGLQQVLWERGFIDANNLAKYTMDGRQDIYGVLVDKSFALKHLMASCQDFEEEETLLQTMGRDMGVLIDRTPKCHCELAGEGIEYSWGCAKNSYRTLALKDKRGKENFRKAVRECLSRQKVLTTERIRTFSCRARAYILAYHKLWCKRQQSGQASQVDEHSTADPVSLEKLMKEFKTHRCAVDFDHSFCSAVIIDLTESDEG